MKNKSLTNNDFKLIKSLHLKKFRDKHGLYIIEGRHLVEEFFNSGIPSRKIKFAVATAEYKDDLHLGKINDKVYYLSESDFGRLSETKNPQGILLVSEIFTNKPSLNSHVIALDNINDPGNLGTIIRNSYWFNTVDLIVGKNSADVFNSKTIRASQGAVFHTAMKINVNLEDELVSLSKKGYKIILTTMDGEKLSSYKFRSDKRYAFVFGNEANGINRKLTDNKLFEKVRIEGFSKCESLNVAVASGIMLYYFRNYNLQ
ncbi:MAG: RNA methyltransferase [Ignavibacteria bacterium]|nr:RNA methyltransferase [Ignavibacteria bacterium]